MIANDLTFAINVTVEDFALWTDTGSVIVNKINNVFGSGDDSYGVNNGIQSLSGTQSPYTYTSTYTVTATPTSWHAPSTPTWAAPSTGYGSKFEFNLAMGEFSDNPQLRSLSRSMSLPHFGARGLLTTNCTTGELFSLIG